MTKKKLARIFNNTERELIMADIAYLKQKEIDNGDRAKWEKSQNWRREIHNYHNNEMLVRFIEACRAAPPLPNYRRNTRGE
jgi:hypothetical protein